MITDSTHRLLTLCAMRVEGKSLDWSLIARCAARKAGLDYLYAGTILGETPAIASKAEPLLRAGLRQIPDAQARVDAELDAGLAAGARVITVLDHDYPATLRLVPDLPPFLFILGEFKPVDLRSVAVVGTRDVSSLGVSRARRMARELVDQGVTVASGLARGVDTAAHTSALDHGGRTIAVMGTGITRRYPSENRSLADAIMRSGALISQFWPTRAPGRDTFPRRNRVTSGISQGTVVIEASSTSGAKMQARLAHQHGKRVWLLRSLVTDQPWARKMVDEGRAKEISSTAEVIDDLTSPTELVSTVAHEGAPEAQLLLDLG